jgi:acyl carrier protein
MTQDITQAVIKAIAQQKMLNSADISTESTLQALNISSLDAITIVYEIEEIFDIQVPNENLEALKTVQDIVDGITDILASKS